MFDFKAIPIHLKNMLVNAWLLPLWYISIYLFSKTTYNVDDIFLISSLCISLNLISSMNLIVWSVLGEYEGEFEVFGLPNILMCFNFQLIWVSLLIFGTYIFNVYSSYIIKFHGFVTIYFVVLNLFFLIEYIIEKNKKKRKSK